MSPDQFPLPSWF